jgi:Leucine-rich repeat (LRR) protein
MHDGAHGDAWRCMACASRKVARSHAPRHANSPARTYPWIVQGGDAEWGLPNLSRTAAAGLQELRLTAFCYPPPKLSIEAARVCTQLRLLTLYGSQVVDLTPLQGCSELQTLNISYSSQLTSLEGLQACGKLKTVDMRFTSVTSVAPLLACADLERLSIYGCQLPSSELAALKAALPRLMIDGP